MKKVIWALTITVVISGLVWVMQEYVNQPTSLPDEIVVEHNDPPAIAETYQFAVPVLMYHRVATLSATAAQDKLLRDLTVSPAEFVAQLRYLRMQGYTIITTGDIVTALREHQPLPERAVAITFDDGYLDNYTVAFPILQRYHAPATIFLVAATVGTPGHLSWNAISTMCQAGILFESHCLHHDDLTSVSPPRLQEDLSLGKAILEARIGTGVTEVAYPSGKSNTSVIDAAYAYGYIAGWDANGGCVTPTSELFHLPRIRIRGTDRLMDFARKLRR